MKVYLKKESNFWNGGSGVLFDCGRYGHSSYSGIHPVLWDGPLLCSEVVEDKSPKTDVAETYMKII